MPKLVIKQDLPEPSITEKLEGLLRVILPIVLLIIALAAALSFYLSRDTHDPVMLGGDHEEIMALPHAYTQEAQHLTALVREFEIQAQTGVEEYTKHARLVGQAEALLAQLEVMDKRVEALAIDADTKQTLLTRHQYQKDYWEAKRVFHDLRLSRFNQPDKAPSIAATSAITLPAETPSPAAVEAAPEPKLALPKDFCPLFGPGAAACRPGAEDKP